VERRDLPLALRHRPGYHRGALVGATILWIAGAKFMNPNEKALTASKPARRKRCAIYTRKSTEEGLEQDFNSLDAQREAGEAYILSQAGEGWVALPRIYDDGGFSGGTMKRPGLCQVNRIHYESSVNR